MKASDLANKLESPGFKLVTPEEEALTRKCVRLAADMEKLRQGGLAITIYPQSNGTVHLNYDGWDYRGTDIYTAARKAVEAAAEGGK